MTATAPTPVEALEPVSHARDTVKHVHACPLCEAMCGLVIETDARTVVGIRGDEQDPFSRGHI